MESNKRRIHRQRHLFFPKKIFKNSGVPLAQPCKIYMPFPICCVEQNPNLEFVINKTDGNFLFKTCGGQKKEKEPWSKNVGVVQAGWCPCWVPKENRSNQYSDTNKIHQWKFTILHPNLRSVITLLTQCKRENEVSNAETGNECFRIQESSSEFTWRPRVLKKLESGRAILAQQVHWGIKTGVTTLSKHMHKT